MIYDQIFHDIFEFLSGKKKFFENFNISENNIISMELA
jgi:hypothetical protein